MITDPHEIANVLGTDGIDYMIQATEGLPVEVRFYAAVLCAGNTLMNPGQDWIITPLILL